MTPIYLDFNASTPVAPEVAVAMRPLLEAHYGNPIVMPLLARAKLSVAGKLGSRALRADAHETIVCAWLSATTLACLGLNALLGWWWADPAAALVMLPLIVREGVEAWRAESCADDETEAA